MWRGALLCAALVGTAQAAGNNVCYLDRATRVATCIVPAEVRANGNIRAAPIYTGSADGVGRRSAATLVVDCARQIAVMRDRAGINIAAAPANETAVLRTLVPEICGIAKPKVDKTLKQFT